jgi:hypothetical protein
MPAEAHQAEKSRKYEPQGCNDGDLRQRKRRQGREHTAAENLQT